MKPTVTLPVGDLYLADCLDVIAALPKRSAAAVISDVPYGIDFDTDYTRFTGGASQRRSAHPRIAGDDRPFDPSPFLSLAPTVVLFGANNYSDRLPQGTWLVWDKRHKGKPLMTSDGEVAWCNRGHGVYIYNHTRDGFLRGPEQGQPRCHPTQKPIALMEWIIEKYTRPGDVVLDPFMGSGTTGIASVLENRPFYGIDQEAEYVEIARKRIDHWRRVGWRK